MEKVILKIVAVDKDGNPLFEVDGKTFKTTSEVVEGDSAYYKVFAFAPDSKEFNTDTKLPDILQGGTVTVKTGDIGAIGVQSQTANDGSQDYISKTQSDIKVGETIFTVKTIDDYKAETETNETFKVVIDTNSYKHPENDVSKAIYENVTIDNTGVTTTIVDNSADKNKPVETNPTIDDGTNPTYGQEDTVWAVIEADKTSVIEGNKVTYTVKLVDKNGNAVTVSSETNVTIKFAGGTNPADLADLLKIFGSDGTTEITGFDSTEQKLTIKIPANGSQTQFTIQTKDDFKSEGNENFDLSISDIASSEFENLVFDKTKTGTDNKVTTEIKDGVTLGNPVDTIVYEDGLNSSATTENSLSKSLGITNPNNDAYTVSFDKTITTTTEKSNGQTITYSYNESGTILTAKRTDGKTVFTVELKKDASGKDVYDFKLIEAMDHSYGNNGKNDFDLPFNFNVTSNGMTSDNIIVTGKQIGRAHV